MSANTRYAICFLVMTGIAGSLYFLGLAMGLPFVITTFATTAGISAFFLRFLRKPEVNPTLKIDGLTLIVFCCCMYLLAKNACMLAAKHGGWDAWAIWNLHAQYLADPAHWRAVFGIREAGHPDYPMCQPSLLAFLYRLAGYRFFLIIAFAYSFIITALIPFMLFSQHVGKNKVVALAVLFLLCQDAWFTGCGVSQYADMTIAAFLLGTFICLDHSSDKKNIAVAAFLLACCAWTKNEGVILAFILLLFYCKTFFRRSNRLYTLAGLVLPAVALIVFKIICPSRNDMIAGQKPEALHKLTDWGRYRFILDSFSANLGQKFYYAEVALFVYIIVLLIQKQKPAMNFYILLVCVLAYMSIYVVTPHDLVWHVSTSQDRLMLQLMPSFLYVFAKKFSEITFSTGNRKMKWQGKEA